VAGRIREGPLFAFRHSLFAVRFKPEVIGAARPSEPLQMTSQRCLTPGSAPDIWRKAKGEERSNGAKPLLPLKSTVGNIPQEL